MENKLFNVKSILRIVITAFLVYGVIYLFDNYDELINGFLEGFNKHD